MVRRKTLLSTVASLLAIGDAVAAFLVNRTIYDTDISRVVYEPANEACAQWSAESLVWQTQTGSTRTCETGVTPWVSERYRLQENFATFHRSLDHRTVSLTVKFEGVAVWLYTPPRGRFSHPIPDYKVCVHDDDKFGSTSSCYRVNGNASLSDSVDNSVPAVFFALGNLWPGKHRVVVSMAEPRDDTQAHDGILFSHAVYSVIRPTPWPVQEDSWRFREATMHATHPALAYSPFINSTTCPNNECGTGLRHYRAENGRMESWHSLELRDGPTHSGVTAKFTAGAVTIYGAPWTQMVTPVHIGNTCVRINSGPCEVIDAFHAYLSSSHDHQPVILWQYEGLNPSRETELSIQLMPTEGPDAVFPFKEIRYLEEREYASPQQPVGQLEEVHVAHDDWAVIYHPGRRCMRHFGRSCTKWFDPWVWREAGPSGSVLTYRSTVASYRTTEDPSIKLEFRGSEVRVYGAPKSLVKPPSAPQQICLNNICQLIDTEQAYLNALSENTTPFSETHPELDPVLLWSMDGLDDQVEHTLRLALAPSPSADDAEMTIAKIVYTKVTYESGESRPETPAPGADSAYAGPPYPPHSTDWREPPPNPPPSPSPSSSSSASPSASPPPVPVPPHSSDPPAPPHSSPPPSMPTPSPPPVNLLMDRILPVVILVIGLCILGSRVYMAMYPRRTPRGLVRFAQV